MKKIFAILLAAAMLISCFAACGSGSTADSRESGSTEAGAAPTAETAGEAGSAEVTEVPEALESAAEAPAAEAIEEPENYFVADDTLKVSLCYQYMNFFSNFWEGGTWESSPWWGEFEKATNIEFDFLMLSQMEFDEQVMLMATSGTLPDVVPQMGKVYPSGLSGAINDGVIYDLGEYLEEYAPHYWALLNADGADTIRDTVLDGGTVAAMYALYDQPNVVPNGLWIRDDLLNGLNLEIPTTLADLKEVLAAFKSEYNIEAPMYTMVGKSMIGIQMTGVSTAFGSPLGFYSYEGDVHCSYIEDSYYEYIAYLKDLAEDGLFVTSEVTTYEQIELMTMGQIGVFGESAANIADQLAVIEQDGASFKAMAAPGDPSECGPTSSLAYTDYYMSVTTNCEHPELIVKMFDYLFTESGSLLASYGIEGVSFSYDENGVPHWTDLVTNNPTGAPYQGTSTYYLNPGFPALHAANVLQDSFSEEYRTEAADIWAKGFSGNAKQALNVSLTTEESDIINATLSDINTYLKERIYAWVFGGAALNEASWSEYIDKMEVMNLTQILETYQAAYDRYLERSL